MNQELKTAILRALAATENLHQVSGSTAVHGGIGGQAITAHCVWHCGPYDHRHAAIIDEWEDSRRNLYRIVETAQLTGG